MIVEINDLQRGGRFIETIHTQTDPFDVHIHIADTIYRISEKDGMLKVIVDGQLLIKPSTTNSVTIATNKHCLPQP
jgi:hypothetical protein